jgi:hypothetical protein
MLQSLTAKVKLKTKVAEPRIDVAMQLYAGGTMRVSDIAEKLGVSSATISIRAKKLGLTPKKRGRWRRKRPSGHQQVILRQLKDLSGAEVARRNQLSRQRVHQIAKRWLVAKDPPTHEGITEFSEKSTTRANGRRVHVISFRLSLTEVSALLAERRQLTVSRAASANQVARAIVSKFLSKELVEENS